MSQFENKRFVVTGAASGIGQAVAQRLVEAGATVYSLDRNQPTVPVHQHVSVDLADVSSIDAALGGLEGAFHGVLNIAGVPGTVPADTVLAVNSLAVRHVTESLLGQLVPGGSVVIVASTAGFGWPQRLDTIKELLATDTFEDGARWFKDHPQEGNAYNFSKEVSTVYALSMGLALNEMGLRVNAVLPGPVETPILTDFEESMGKDNLDAVKELLGRHATPDDVAEVVLFLASDEARWVNGHALVVDGGITGAVLSGLVPVPEF